MLPKHVRYQTALHPVVPVSLACPAGDFLSIHPFQQFVNPQNEFFCGFFDSFWAFFGKSPQMPVFSAFFRFPLPVIRGVFGSYPPAKPSARPCRSAKRRFRTWTKPSPSAALPRRAICSATGRPSGRLPPRSSSPNPASTKTCSSTFRRRMQPSPARCRRCWHTTSPSAICAAAKRRGGVMHRKKPKICGVLAIS